MSAHRRMRAYMDKHKVGALFEDLMSKLVSEMPSEPVPFLIRVLQQKLCQVVPQTVMTIPRLRRSLGDLALTIDVEKVPVHKKPSSALVRRSRPSTPSVPLPHPPPRKTVTLSCPKEKQVDSDKTEFKSPWPDSCNPVLISHHSDKNVFDVSQGEVTHASQRVKASTEPPLRNNKKYQTSGYNGPILPGQVFDEDPLDDELIVFGPKRTSTIKLNNFNNSNKSSTNEIKMYHESNAISSKSSSMAYTRNDSFANKRMDFFGTIEMFEDPQDLLDEGIYISQGTGFKVSNSDYKSDQNGRRESLHFNICSVCTKMSKYQDYLEDGLSSSDDNFKISSPIPEKNKYGHSFQAPNSTTNKSDFSKPANKIIPVIPSVTNVFRANTKSPNSLSVLDTERTTSTEDLFSTSRSLPLPLTPVDKVTLEWCTPSLEAIHACANGWEVITSQDSELF